MIEIFLIVSLVYLCIVFYTIASTPWEVVYFNKWEDLSLLGKIVRIYLKPVAAIMDFVNKVLNKQK